jgi:hypothetical protein
MAMLAGFATASAQSMYAFTISVPEIDPAGASSAVALVVGCLSLIERRRRVGITG